MKRTVYLILTLAILSASSNIGGQEGIPGPYLKFSLFSDLDQIWVLVEDGHQTDSHVTDDTTLLHLKREGQFVTLRTIGGSANFPFQQARLDVGTVSHIEFREHMWRVYRAKFVIRVTDPQSWNTKGLLGIVEGGVPILHIIPRYDSLVLNEFLKPTRRLRSFRVVASSPHNRADISILLPPSCTMSLGKWKVRNSNIGPTKLDTICVTAGLGRVVISTIGSGGDTTSNTILHAIDIAGGSQSWSVSAEQTKHTAGATYVQVYFRPQFDLNLPYGKVLIRFRTEDSRRTIQDTVLIADIQFLDN